MDCLNLGLQLLVDAFPSSEAGVHNGRLLTSGVPIGVPFFFTLFQNIQPRSSKRDSGHGIHISRMALTFSNKVTVLWFSNMGEAGVLSGVQFGVLLTCSLVTEYFYCYCLKL